MTFMQKEFCRHYVAGHGCQTAALMAGYSAQVAQFGGKDFLANRYIIARIGRLRSNTYLSHQEILAHKAKLTEVLADATDPLLIIRTINSIARLAKLRPANLPDEDEEYPSRDHYNVQQGDAPSSATPTSAFTKAYPIYEIIAQPADSQLNKFVSEYFKPHLKLWPTTAITPAATPPATSAEPSIVSTAVPSGQDSPNPSIAPDSQSLLVPANLPPPNPEANPITPHPIHHPPIP